MHVLATQIAVAIQNPALRATAFEHFPASFVTQLVETAQRFERRTRNQIANELFRLGEIFVCAQAKLVDSAPAGDLR